MNGYVSNEQAQAYIPTIINAWNLYYTPILANLSIMNSKIIGKQYRFNNFNIITRIFYQVVSNYSTNFDAFNYQGKISSLLQVPYGSPNLVARSFIKISQRNLVRKLNLDLLLEQLPQIKIENEITHKDKRNIEKILQTFWMNSIIYYFPIKIIISNSRILCILLVLKSQYQSINLQLATSQEYYDTKKNIKISKLFYIIQANDTVLYLNSLPILNTPMVCLIL